MRLESMSRDELIKVAQDSTPFVLGMQNQIDDLYRQIKQNEYLVKRAENLRKANELLSIENNNLSTSNELMKTEIRKLKRQLSKHKTTAPLPPKPKNVHAKDDSPAWML
jgi:predicted RNase H-like nuclease (RuvC/YqgF family)